MTRLTKNEVFGSNLFKVRATLLFDLLFQVIDIAIDWYHDLERGFISIDEAPKSIL
jgi:hypothetical protein